MISSWLISTYWLLVLNFFISGNLIQEASINIGSIQEDPNRGDPSREDPSRDDPIQDDPNHALYLSITDMEISESKADFKVKVFSDDLRDALKSYRPSEYKPADMQRYFSLNQDLANNYFEEHFLLWAGEKKLALQVKGATIENDAHFINFSCSIPQNLKELRVKADFFMELFPTQTNVVKVKSGAQVQYLKFNMPVVPQKLSF